MYEIIEGFKHKINQLKQNCSKLNKNNIKLKRIINNSKIVFSKRKKISQLRKNKKYEKFSNATKKLCLIIYFVFQTKYFINFNFVIKNVPMI